MPVNPKFLAARATERRHRDLIHAGAPCWLPLRRGEAILARTPLVPLTFRHRLDLRLQGNAFFAGHEWAPLPVDVFLFLWRLHPLHVKPRLAREHAVAYLARSQFRFFRVWYALGSFRAACIHRSLTLFVQRCDISAAIESIQAFLAAANQDAPGAPVGASARVSLVAPESHDADNHCDWLMTAYRMSHAEALDTPIALAHQLYRERILRTPEGELEIFAPSDALL